MEDTKNTNGWTIVGVSGCTNAGKTTLASALTNYFSGSVMVKQDDYFRSDDSKEHVVIPELNHKNWERLEAVNWEGMGENLRNILSKPPPDQKSLLVIDGHIIFNHPKIRELFHKKYFLTLENNVCASRRKLRVYNPPDIPRYFEFCVWPMYLSNLEDVKAHCPDVLYFDGTSDPGLIFEAVKDDIEMYFTQKYL